MNISKDAIMEELKKQVRWINESECYIGRIHIGGLSWDACNPPKNKKWQVHYCYARLKPEFRHWSSIDEAKKFVEERLVSQFIDRLFMS